MNSAERDHYCSYSAHAFDRNSSLYLPRTSLRCGGSGGTNTAHWLHSYLPFEFVIGKTPLSSVHAPLITCALYLLMVFTLKQIMKERKAFDLKKVSCRQSAARVRACDASALTHPSCTALCLALLPFASAGGDGVQFHDVVRLRRVVFHARA